MRFLSKLVLHNAGLKLLSLATAFLLWASYTSEPQVEVGYDVPIEFVNVPQDLEIAADAPAEVHVRLRGRSMLLRRLAPTDIDVRVDLSGMSAGQMQYRPVASELGLPPGVDVVRIVPSELRIQLEPRKP
jgi:YbbR domain-containing protein